MTDPAFSTGWPACFAFWKLNVSFPAGALSIEEIVVRWIHIVAGIIWMGFLGFFILAVAPTLKSLDPGAEVLILIATPYWYGVETHDGQHGWLRRDELEQVP